MKATNKKVNDARVMPHSIEAEQCVLGCAFIDQDAGYNIMATLKENDFYSETHKIIFNSMYKVFSANIPIDFVTITENLEKNGLLDSVGGVDYITSLTNIIPSASNYVHYMNIVKNDSVLRQLIAAGQDIINKAYEDIDREDALSYANASNEKNKSNIIITEGFFIYPKILWHQKIPVNEYIRTNTWRNFPQSYLESEGFLNYRFKDKLDIDDISTDNIYITNSSYRYFFYKFNLKQFGQYIVATPK